MRTPIDLIVAKYVHQMEAQRAWNDLDAYDREIIDMARVERDENGDLHYKDRDDLNRKEGKNMGALVGGLMGPCRVARSRHWSGGRHCCRSFNRAGRR